MRNIEEKCQTTVNSQKHKQAEMKPAYAINRKWWEDRGRDLLQRMAWNELPHTGNTMFKLLVILQLGSGLSQWKKLMFDMFRLKNMVINTTIKNNFRHL